MKYIVLALALIACSDSKPAPAPAPAPAPSGSSDYIRMVATHHKPKPTDPVIVDIPTFQVVRADFDPANLEGGTAELALDLTSLTSGSAKRDNHLKGPDYLDVAAFGTGKVVIDNVKKTGDKTYSADATVNVHGIEKKFPVAFDVLSTTADSIRIKGAHTFPRLDFAMGKPIGEDSVAEQVTIEMQLTLKKTT